MALCSDPLGMKWTRPGPSCEGLGSRHVRTSLQGPRLSAWQSSAARGRLSGCGDTGLLTGAATGPGRRPPTVGSDTGSELRPHLRTSPADLTCVAYLRSVAGGRTAAPLLGLRARTLHSWLCRWDRRGLMRKQKKQLQKEVQNSSAHTRTTLTG